ncbi:putative quinol monooxygenase [Candidatus Methanosphaera massiliense]|jgi:quinol monooxygenase YgiN|uniref:putative quinol monooxygenase n=1 Tax=Methanosphaera TaxID=2316 RepID=UPI002380028E|nr:antibiotic biosynthesis monooxygenase [Candidatus Methanosphaera massiliense]MDD6286274.1 antibiotic biosynthesis monooxygenase [Methanobacteriaceae archaeon]MDE4077561.1 antibiotic biosynthesis monooxygenase [Candidatus Methanosphaera massiliense]MDY2744216.1 antibiotic biosynthesis monooxygenase [Methanosphaera sp.]
MSITMNLYYTGSGENAVKFAKEMISSGTVDKIRSNSGNLRYEYFTSINNPETVLLIDSWKNQSALDKHHSSETMGTILKLRDKYDLTVTAERYVSDDTGIPKKDQKFLDK